MSCSTPFQGMKMRAVAPTIEEAFRKISLALSVDGFHVASVNPERFSIETEWREAKDKEKSERDLSFTGETIETRIVAKCERRGSLYDIFVTPYLKYSRGGASQEVIADVYHPLWEKWQRTVHTLVQVEAREED